MRRRRLRERKTFRGTIYGDTLMVERGCWRKTIDADGNDVGGSHDPHAAPWLNIGDQVVAYPRDLLSDAIACLEIVEMRRATSMTVRVVYGDAVSGAVYLMPAVKQQTRTAT